MDAPGGRYKIVERGRRLVTVDLMTGQEVGVSSSVIPPQSSKQAMEIPRNGASLSSLPIASPAALIPSLLDLTRKAETSDRPLGGPWGDTNTAPSPRPQGKVMPRSANLPAGNFIIRTSASYDLHGPRDVQLSAFGILWWMITHHIRVIFFLIIGFVLFSWLLMFTPLLLIKGVRHGVLSLFRPSLTTLFDDADQAAAG